MSEVAKNTPKFSLSAALAEPDKIPKEQLDAQYSTMGDSVTVINQMLQDLADIGEGNKPTHQENMTIRERADAIKRNKQHLELMVAKDQWEDYDMTEVNDCIKRSNDMLSS